MNSDLKDDSYVLPDQLLDLLKSNLKTLSPGDKGYDRCNNMVNDGSLTYPQAKKFKHELENELEGDNYEVVGGDDILNFINDSLTRRRDGVHNSKKIRQDSGEENVFKKTHTKDKSKNPTKIRKIKVATSSDDINNNRAVYEEISRIKELIK
jgi:polyhydroxyalkanoate synthesis regulator phasin